MCKSNEVPADNGLGHAFGSIEGTSMDFLRLLGQSGQIESAL